MSKKVLPFLLLLGVALLGAWAIAATPQFTELNIAAAASLKDVLADLQQLYRQKEPNTKLNLILGSSGALQAQIEQGAPSDLFIAAAAKQMDALEKKGLLMKGSRKNLVENRLVLIVPKDSGLRIRDFKDLARNAVKKIGIGAPASVPAGQYAQQVLANLKIWDRVQGKTVLGTDVRAVLTYVETGNVDAGIVYRTDALVSDKVNIAATADEGLHDPIIYPAAVPAHTEHAKEAAAFLSFLSSPEAKAVFEKYGFIIGK